MWRVDLDQEICQVIKQCQEEYYLTTAELLHENLSICSSDDVEMLLEDAAKDKLTYQTEDGLWHLTFIGLEEFARLGSSIP